jgi:transcriptional regulator with XRE-family HTH domain
MSCLFKNSRLLLPGLIPDKDGARKIMKNEDVSLYIQDTREKLGLGRTEFANLLGMNTAGERTVRGWESGEHKPTPKKLTDITNLESTLQEIRKNAPFADNRPKGDFRFVDLFVNQRAKLTRVLGKTALKSFHPRLCKIRYFVGEPWSVNHGYNCRSQKTTPCQWREY